MSQRDEENNAALLPAGSSTWPTLSHARRENFPSPSPSPATRETRVAARPLPLVGLLSQTNAGGGCAEVQSKCRTSSATIRVLSRSRDSVELLLTEEDKR